MDIDHLEELINEAGYHIVEVSGGFVWECLDDGTTADRVFEFVDDAIDDCIVFNKLLGDG